MAEVKSPTPASEWRRRAEATQLVELPSGNKLRIKRRPLTAIMRSGVVPTRLYQTAMGLDSEKSLSDLNPEETKHFIELLTVVVCAVVVEPKVVTTGIEPGDGEISIDDLSDADQFHVMTVAFSRGGEESDELTRFPKEAGSSDSRPSSETLRPEAVGATGNQGSLDGAGSGHGPSDENDSRGDAKAQ